MKNQRVVVTGLLGMATGLLFAVLPAAAQGAKPPAQITIKNMRTAPLTMFEIATGGD